jgi:hypothetical protein
MKWKDSGEANEPQEEKTKEEFFDEEHYSPWAARKESVKGSRVSKFPLIFILLGLAIVTSLAALLTLLLSSKSAGPGNKEYALLEDRMRQAEERLNNYEVIDEKVTKIWEQAKVFEKFQERFERSEASVSLRMDHITTSVEAMQKQIAEVRKAAPPAAEKKASDKETSSATKKKSTNQDSAAPKMQYHTVAAGDTFYSISKRYNISLEELLQMNQLDKNSTLQLGQKLVVGKE